MNVILKADHICVAYEGKKVVDHVSFEVERGDYLCIVGNNGSGKSTLAKTLAKKLEFIYFLFLRGFILTKHSQ